MPLANKPRRGTLDLGVSCPGQSSGAPESELLRHLRLQRRQVQQRLPPRLAVVPWRVHQKPSTLWALSSFGHSCLLCRSPATKMVIWLSWEALVTGSPSTHEPVRGTEAGGHCGSGRSSQPQSCRRRCRGRPLSEEQAQGWAASAAGASLAELWGALMVGPAAGSSASGSR